MEAWGLQGGLEETDEVVLWKDNPRFYSYFVNKNGLIDWLIDLLIDWLDYILCFDNCVKMHITKTFEH